MTTWRSSLALVLLLALAGCAGIAGGDRPATMASCKALCAVEAAGPGCSPATNVCDAFCVADGTAFQEECLVTAKAYYDCAATLAYTCPTAPDRPETSDSTCDAEEHAYLVCKVGGS